MRLDGKVAVVTGAGSGIGKAIALAFAREGAAVAVVDVNVDAGEAVHREIVHGGGFAVHLGGDVASRSDARAMVRGTVDQFGRVDVLVNNAGIVREAPFLSVEDDDWDRMMRVNLKGVFLCSQAAAEHMVARRSGKIVNISSRAFLGAIDQSAYVASKGGVVSLTRAMALELGPHGINVNSVAPGVIDTPLLRNVDSTRLQRYLAAQPMGSFGRPEDIAAAALFLASDEATFITGQTLIVDGGRSLGGALA